MRAQDKQVERDTFDRERHSDYENMPDTVHARIRGALLRARPGIESATLRALEIGCGTGAFGRRLIESCPGAEVTGIDIAPAMIAWVQEKGVSRYTGIVGDAEDRSLFPESTFDLVICPMVLHHFPDPGQVLRNASMWIKPGGLLLVSEPNGSSPVNQLFKLGRRSLEVVCGVEYTRRFATPNETDHPMSRYLRILSQAGFRVLSRETFLDRPATPPKFLLWRVREWLNTLGNLLPSPHCGNGLLIVAERNA